MWVGDCSLPNGITDILLRLKQNLAVMKKCNIYENTHYLFYSNQLMMIHKDCCRRTLLNQPVKKMLVKCCVLGYH
jgi:hypothetical protein